MLMHGLRSAEVIALNRDDVLLSEGQLRVHGKGSKMRFRLWRRRPRNYSITTCAWSGPIAALRHCS